MAEPFAAHAAVALARARQAAQLGAAVDSRTVIGQAIGILMERYQVDEDRAFQSLVRASSTGNAKLRDIAGELVDQLGSRVSAR